jgi:uncharacterized protein YukE
MAAKRQLLLELLAKDSTGPATKGAAENLDLVAASAEDAAKATDNLGDQAGQSKEEVERFGKSNRTAAEHAERLQREIESCEKELHQLAVAFAEADAVADRTDLSKSIRRTQSDLRKLNKNKGLIDDLVPSEADIEQEFESLAPVVEKESTKLFAGVSDVAVPALAGLAVAAAPQIGATISGAIIGAVGLGGVVGGFAIAAKDPRVKQAASSMKTAIGDELKDAATPFVNTSIKGISQVGGAVKRINFGQIFQDSAKNAIPLIDGATDAVEKLGGAIENVIHNSGPVVTEIGHELSAFSGVLADGLNSLADNGEQGAEALHQLFLVVNGTVSAVFSLVNGLTEVYGALDKISGGGPTHLLDVWAASTANVADKSRDLAQALVDEGVPAMNDFGDAVLTDGASLNELADAADRAAQAQLGLFGDATAVAKAEDAATEAAKKNGRTLDEHTKKGQANRDALTTLGGALIRNAEDYRDLNGVGPKTDAVMASNRKAFLRAAEGMTTSHQAAVDLTNAIFGIPAKKSPVVHASVTGKEKLDELGHRIQGINSKSVTVSVSVTGEERLDTLGHRIGGYRAGGGPVKKGKAYVVGEKRAELFVPDRDGTIIPSIDQLGAGGGSGGGSPAGTRTVAVENRITFDFANAQSLMARALIEMLRTQPGFRATVVKTLQL